MPLKQAVCTLFICLLAGLQSMGQQWQLSQQYTPPDVRSNNLFGNAVDIDGNYAIASAHRHSPIINSDTLTQSGAAYIFEKDANGKWNEAQKLTAPDAVAYDYFGIDVGISGTTAVVGAHYNSSDTDNENPMPAAGAVYVFERDEESGTWQFWQKLTASDRNTLDWFGQSLSIHQNCLIIGAPGEDEEDNTAVGAVYVFEKGNNNFWVQQHKIENQNGDTNSHFGKEVALHQNNAVILEDFDAIAYQLNQKGWVETFKYSMNVPPYWSATPVAIDLNDDIMLIYDSYRFCRGIVEHGFGMVLIYEKTQNNFWNLTDTICQLDSLTTSLSESLALNENNQILLSSYEELRDDDKVTKNRTAFLLERDSIIKNWVIKQKLPDENRERIIYLDNFYYQNKVALSNEDVILTSPLLPINGQSNAGAIFLANADIKSNISIYQIENPLLKFYPNPFKNEIYTEVPALFKIENINVYNSLMQSIPYSILNENNRLKIEINSSSGIYFINYKQSNNSLQNYKIIKH